MRLVAHRRRKPLIYNINYTAIKKIISILLKYFRIKDRHVVAGRFISESV